MSSEPLRASLPPPSYSTIQPAVPRCSHRRPIVAASTSASPTAAISTSSQSPQPLLPAIISPVPFYTSAGTYFVPNSPLVIVPPRQTVPPAPTSFESEDEDNSELHCMQCSRCCSNARFKNTARALILGQLMSLCLCGTGISSELLARCGFKSPTAQSFPTYFLLLFTYGLILMCRSGDRNAINVLRVRGWKYALLALVDVQANFLIVNAYQYTNLTSIQILDCATIPIVMCLSYLFLSVRYMISHLIGVIVCLVGIGLVIVADAGHGSEGGSNRVLGDLLCIGATLCYGVANVSEEFLVKAFDRTEYLAMVGLFGSIISGTQSAILEHSNLTSFHWTGSALLELALFTGCMFAFYSLVSYVMAKTSALMFNLAVLTADFYSLLAGIFIFSYTFNVLYLVSFFVVVAGSIIYSVRKTEERSRDEANFVSRLLCLCCPCEACVECRPRAAYTVRDAQRTPSIHSETPQSSRSSPDSS